MAIGGYSINEYCGYSINGYWRLLVVILFMIILLMAIGGYFINDYSINGYWWLFY